MKHREIEPCPFCGSLDLDVTDAPHGVQCNNCNAIGPREPGRHKIDIWNVRSNFDYRGDVTALQVKERLDEFFQDLRTSLAQLIKATR